MTQKWLLGGHSSQRSVFADHETDTLLAPGFLLLLQITAAHCCRQYAWHATAWHAAAHKLKTECDHRLTMAIEHDVNIVLCMTERRIYNTVSAWACKTLGQLVSPLTLAPSTMQEVSNLSRAQTSKLLLAEASDSQYVNSTRCCVQKLGSLQSSVCCFTLSTNPP
jgi:hypothetical protein